MHSATESQAPTGAYPGLIDRVLQYERVKTPPTGAEGAFGRPFAAERSTADQLLATSATRPLSADEHQDLSGIIVSLPGLAAADADRRATALENDARTAGRVAMRLSFWTVPPCC